MFFKQSVVLLLTVAVFACFGSQNLTSSENMVFEEFTEITEDGAAIALELAQEHMKATGLDLVIGDPEPLYGYGYGDKQIAYLIIGHPTGEFASMAEYQAFVSYLSKVRNEFQGYYDLAQELDVLPRDSLLPDEVRQEFRNLNVRWGGRFMYVIASTSSGYKLLQACNIGNIAIRKYPETEEETIGYALYCREDYTLTLEENKILQYSIRPVYRNYDNLQNFPHEFPGYLYKPYYFEGHILSVIYNNSRYGRRPN